MLHFSGATTGSSLSLFSLEKNTASTTKEYSLSNSGLLQINFKKITMLFI